MLKLRYDTKTDWIDVINTDLNSFLQDHAANERKVSQAAITLAVQNPLRTELVRELIAVSIEELEHFQQVHELLLARGSDLGFDTPDPYMGHLQRLLRKADVNEYLLDRLLVFGIVEARGCERFSMVADGATDEKVREFYTELTRSEARHHALYHRLARLYFDEDVVAARLDELLDAEAGIVASAFLIEARCTDARTYRIAPDL